MLLKKEGGGRGWKLKARSSARPWKLFTLPALSRSGEKSALSALFYAARLLLFSAASQLFLRNSPERFFGSCSPRRRSLPAADKCSPLFGPPGSAGVNCAWRTEILLRDPETIADSGIETSPARRLARGRCTRWFLTSCLGFSVGLYCQSCAEKNNLN